MDSAALDLEFDRLRNRLDEERNLKSLIHQYRRGKSPLKGLYGGNSLKFADVEDERQYTQFVAMSKLNMAPLIVDSIVDDVTLVSFSEVIENPIDAGTAPDEEPDQIEGESTDLEGEEEVDVTGVSREALRRMKVMRLASTASKIFADEMHHGTGYGYVDEDNEGKILYIDTRCAYVDTDPVDIWDRRAAVIEVYRNPDKETDDLGELIRVLAFIRDPDTGRIHRVVEDYLDENGDARITAEREYTVLRGSRIPVVKAETPEGVGIYENHLGTMDRINFLIFSRLVVADKQSFKELWIKGLPAFIQNPETGAYEAIKWDAELLRGPGNANLLPGENADVKETGVTDFSPFTATVFSEIKHLAALTSTPLYILDPSSAQQSALGADLADKVHRTKVRTMRRTLADCLTELMSISFEATGDAERVFEAEWAPMEDESMSSRAQAASMVRNILPVEFIWSDILRLDPEQIAMAKSQMQQELTDDMMLVYSAHADALLALREMREQQAQPSLESELVVAENIEETPTSIEAGQLSAVTNPEDPADPSNFIIVFLQDHGGGAWAREVIEAGVRQGFRENALKTARTRMSDLVISTRRRYGRSTANYWQMNQARNRVGENK